MRRGVGAAVLVLLVVSAGCLAGTGGDGGPLTGEDSAAGGADSTDGPAGTVNFYVSDQPSDMDDFEHLNVTVTAVRFEMVENGTEAPNATATVTAAQDGENETEAEVETEDERESDEREDDDERADARWVTREVNETTVDLTRLRGANATLVDRFDLPAGEYDRVVLEVSETNGTLKDGTTADVKLPSEKLQLDVAFEVGDGAEVDFVYDVTVHEAGNSGQYILKPVVSESGTEVPIERVDDDRDEREDETETALTASFEGPVAAGENVTVTVTRAGDPVANATVALDDGDWTGTTDADGRVTVAVPADAEAVELEVTAGDEEAELERDLADDESGEDDRPSDGQGANGQADGDQ